MRGGRKSGVIMRLIKAEDVKELINGLDSLPWEEEVDDLVNSLPTVEAEPVVHCKDCKSFMEYTKEYTLSVEGADGDCYIRIMNSDDKQFCSCKYDDFCSYGSKMDGKSKV